MTIDNPLLDRVRKLLAKAEAEGATPDEAQALTAKAAELMARYGIDRALLAAQLPETDRPTDRKIDIENPWSRVRAHLLCGLADAMRCQSVIVSSSQTSTRIHIFGYASDIERTDVLYSSLLVQMWRGLAATEVPAGAFSRQEWQRSWLLGFTAAVVIRVRVAEERVVDEAEREDAGTGPGMQLVLADRSRVIQQAFDHAYSTTRSTWMTFSDGGYDTGYRRGQQADLGSGHLAGKPPQALGDG